MRKNNNNNYQPKTPKIQTYMAIVATLPMLGDGIWRVGGFFLCAYLILSGQVVTALAFLPIFLKHYFN
ncbi:hypothetical protein [Sporosarcina ureilytica]|uniref:Uncharacterized protein n=1 Tax=Sporosarcina ureilytica TaxID=298596 RepID=A0A1D8JH51_9BACL|nr:hypothetical protein [Sporosarcina ureilytica]AOV08018.1 hypothetical protein BI350_11035 [Sporosarcina ureilytica]